MDIDGRRGKPTGDANSSRAPGPTSSLLGIRRGSMWCSIGSSEAVDPVLYRPADSQIGADVIYEVGKLRMAASPSIQSRPLIPQRHGGNPKKSCSYDVHMNTAHSAHTGSEEFVVI
ncbi:hypothetical protein FSP39_017203 [Pinctada imbricata]|uniref:Uncharacterized protein n=1 Tax=Pinctada imbricata TaxID=66713 RepID=A0AA88XRQ2_PINIB|nr:hypothetical protein FSP39_017203 [Pinctada imbricata]